MSQHDNRKLRATNTSGFTGVYKIAERRYSSMIRINRKLKNLGTFKTATLAANAFDKAAINARKPIEVLNFPKKAPSDFKPLPQKLNKGNTLGVRGVKLTRVPGRFLARISVNGKETVLGTFGNIKEAAIAYDRAVLKFKKSVSLLNYPDMVHNLNVEPMIKKRKLSSRNTTDFRGVTKMANERYQARIGGINKKRLTIGTFNSSEEAAIEYDRAVLMYNKPKGFLNFPERWFDPKTGEMSLQLFPVTSASNTCSKRSRSKSSSNNNHKNVKKRKRNSNKSSTVAAGDPAAKLLLLLNPTNK